MVHVRDKEWACVINENYMRDPEGVTKVDRKLLSGDCSIN